jgi:hypothetical protein
VGGSKMSNVRCAVRRHNNPFVWLLVVLLIWSAYPAFMEKEKVDDHITAPK